MIVRKGIVGSLFLRVRHRYWASSVAQMDTASRSKVGLLPCGLPTECRVREQKEN